MGLQTTAWALPGDCDGPRDALPHPRWRVAAESFLGVFSFENLASWDWLSAIDLLRLELHFDEYDCNCNAVLFQQSSHVKFGNSEIKCSDVYFSYLD